MSSVPKHVMDEFLSPGLAVWGEPASPDPDRFLKEYGDVLKGFPRDVLTAAYRDLRQSHKGPTRWPRIPEIVEACDHAQERLRPKRASVSVIDDWHRKARNAEALMMNSEVGQQAAQDGWANGCREFIMRHGRLPKEYETGHLISNARFVDQCAAGEVNMGLLHNVLMGLAGGIVQRRHQIAYRVINGIERGDQGDPSPYAPTFKVREE